MPWKPKEKDLTEEEAIALAKTELSPFWHSSPPLFVALQDEKKQTQIYPLQSDFIEKKWALLIADPMTLSGENSFKQFMEFQTRYSTLGIHFLAVLVSSYEFMKDTTALEKILQRLDPDYICALDADQMIQTAFKVKTGPDFFLLSNGAIQAHHHGLHATQEFETSIQAFIRSNEKGLPLLQLFHPLQPPQCDTGSFEFPKDVKNPEIEMVGNWKIEKNWIETEDSDARIIFKAQSSFVSLVVGPAKELMQTETCRTAIEINDAPVLDVFSGNHIEFDEEGRTVIRSHNANIFHALKGLTDDQKKVTLFFPVAKRIAVRIYAIKFSEPLNSQMPEPSSS